MSPGNHQPTPGWETGGQAEYNTPGTNRLAHPTSPCPDCPADLLTALVLDTHTGQTGLVVTVIHENTCPNYGSGDPERAAWLDDLVDGGRQ